MTEPAFPENQKNSQGNIDNLKESIIGMKTMIDSLTEEVVKLEEKKKQMMSEITYNDNLLNEIFESIAQDNREFLDKIKSSNDPSKPVILNRNEVFLKRNFRRIKENLEEKSVNLDLDPRRNTQDVSELSRDKSSKQGANKDSASDHLKSLDAENRYIITKLSNLNLNGLTADVKALTYAHLFQEKGLPN